MGDLQETIASALDSSPELGIAEVVAGVQFGASRMLAVDHVKSVADGQVVVTLINGDRILVAVSRVS